MVTGLKYALKSVSTKANSCELHISGCSPLLEIWVAYHISLKPCSEMRFPHILSWTTFKGRTTFVLEDFETNRVVHKLRFSESDLKNEVLAEAIGNPEVTEYTPNLLLDMEIVQRDQRLLFEKERWLLLNMGYLEDEVKKLKEEIMEEAQEHKMEDE